MKITFKSIKHIVNLLTTTEWIDRYNPRVRIERIQAQLMGANVDDAKKTTLEASLAKLKLETQASSKYELTLEHAGISRNEGQLLLAVLHLMYNTKSGFEPVAQKALITLLQRNFKNLNCPELYLQLRNMYPDITYIAPNKLNNPFNIELYKLIYPYTLIIASYLNDINNIDLDIDSVEMADKLSTYFFNLDDAENYMKTIDYSTAQTIMLSFQYDIPDIEITNIQLKNYMLFLQKLNGYVNVLGRDSLNLLRFFELLKQNTEFQSIVHDNDNIKLLNQKNNKQNSVKVKTIISQIKNIITNTVYPFNPLDYPPDMTNDLNKFATSALDFGLLPSAFEAALQIISSNKLATSDILPDIHFKFKINNEEYQFYKLPKKDLRGFILGKLTNSCQYIGGHATKCVEDGMIKDTAGFYIINDSTGKIRAQSYAWIANSREKPYIVLDSFEYLGLEDIKLFIPAVNILHTALYSYYLEVKVQYELFIGVGGQTPKMKINSELRPLPIDPTLNLYGDSAKVYHITQEIVPSDLESTAPSMLNSPSTVLTSYEELEQNNPFIILEKFKLNIPNISNIFIAEHYQAIILLTKMCGSENMVNLIKAHKYIVVDWQQYVTEIGHLVQNVHTTDTQWLKDLYIQDEHTWELCLNDEYATLGTIEYIFLEPKNMLLFISEHQSLFVKTLSQFNYLYKFIQSFSIERHTMSQIFMQYYPIAEHIINHISTLSSLKHPRSFNFNYIVELYKTSPELSLEIIDRFEIFISLDKYIKLSKIVAIYNKDESVFNHIINNHKLIKGACILEHIDSRVTSWFSTDDLIRLVQNQVSYASLKKKYYLSSFIEFLKAKQQLGVIQDPYNILNCRTKKDTNPNIVCGERKEILDYRPLLELDQTEIQATNQQYADVISMAIAWTTDLAELHDRFYDLVKQNSNVYDLMNEGSENVSAREQQILNRASHFHNMLHNNQKKLLSPADLTPSFFKYNKVLVYTNSRATLLVLKAESYFKIYSSNLNYHTMYRTPNDSNEQLRLFVNAFFKWQHDGSDIIHIHTLNSEIPSLLINKIKGYISHYDAFMTDAQRLLLNDNSNIKSIKVKTIIKAFALGGHTIDMRILNNKFFQEHKINLTFRVQRLHEVLQSLCLKEQKALFHVIKQYSIPGLWDTATSYTDNMQKAIESYTHSVTTYIKNNDFIDLKTLSQFSWEIFNHFITSQENIPEKLQHSIINNFKRTYKTYADHLSISTNVLFFFPSIIDAINTKQYMGLIETASILASDALFTEVIDKITPLLSIERANLLSKFSIKNPMMKIVTMDAIIELHKELYNLPEHDERRKLIKHALYSQYAATGIMVIEILGLMETAPLWIMLLGAQLITSASDLVAYEKIDVSFIESIKLVLHFDQDLMMKIKDERTLVNTILSYQSPENSGYCIVHVPKIKEEVWKNVNISDVPVPVRNWLKAHVHSSSVEYYGPNQKIISTDHYRYIEQYTTQRHCCPPVMYLKVINRIWQIKTFLVVPTTSNLEFGEYNNDAMIHQDSNNWFISEVSEANKTWYRVPQIPVAYSGWGRPHFFFQSKYHLTGPTVHITDPISLGSTGYSALYTRPQAGLAEVTNLNQIFFAFDPRKGSINILFTDKGFTTLDQLNYAYLNYLTKSIKYKRNQDYIINVLVHKPDFPILYQDSNTISRLSINSSLIRLTASYHLIVHNNTCIIHDHTLNTRFTLSSLVTPNHQFTPSYVSGKEDHFKITSINNQSNITVFLNNHKKSLYVDFGTIPIRERIMFDAQDLILKNVTSYMSEYSVLNIASETRTFFLELNGNIIVNDGLSELKVFGSAVNQAITYKKYQSLDNTSDTTAYKIYNIDIGSVLRNIAERAIFNTNYTFDAYANLINQGHVVNIEVIHWTFNVHSAKCDFLFRPNHKVSVGGQDNGYQTVLNFYDMIFSLYKINAIGQVITREYILLSQKNFFIKEQVHLKQILDFQTDDNNHKMLIQQYVDTNTKISDNNHLLIDLIANGRVYVFSTSDALTIRLYVLTQSPEFIINDIIYEIIDHKIYAIGGKDNKINVYELLLKNSISHNRVPVLFKKNLLNVDINCIGGDISIDNTSIQNTMSDTDLVFDDHIISLDNLRELLSCNPLYSNRSKRSTKDDLVPIDELLHVPTTSGASKLHSPLHNAFKDGILYPMLHLGHYMNSMVKSIANNIHNLFMIHDIQEYYTYKSNDLQVSQNCDIPTNAGDNKPTRHQTYASKKINLHNNIIGIQYDGQSIDDNPCCAQNNTEEALLYTTIPTHINQPIKHAYSAHYKCYNTLQCYNQDMVYYDVRENSFNYTPILSQCTWDLNSNLILGRVAIHMVKKFMKWSMSSKQAESLNSAYINKSLINTINCHINNIKSSVKIVYENSFVLNAHKSIIKHCCGVLEFLRGNEKKQLQPLVAAPIKEINSTNKQSKITVLEIEETQDFDSNNNSTVAHPKYISPIYCDSIYSIDLSGTNAYCE